MLKVRNYLHISILFLTFALSKTNNMTRLIIIDHDKHEAYIEDVTEEDLKPYNGSEQEYIMDNYGFDEDYFFSWDYITDITYYNADDKMGDEVVGFKLKE